MGLARLEAHPVDPVILSDELPVFPFLDQPPDCGHLETANRSG